MSATSVTIARPAAEKQPGKISGLFASAWDVVAGYVVRRTAIATLRELDDRALRDIGIARSEIEGVVQGFISLPDRARMS